VGTSGLNANGLIEKGRAWTKKKIEEGWRMTCMGLLSKEDIKEAGLVYDNRLETVYDYEEKKFVERPLGYHAIPSQEYIREDSRFGEKGSKYEAPTQQFLAWYHRRKEKQKEYTDKNEDYINSQIKKSSSNNIVNMFGGELM
jgi:hypothetical protein